MASEEIAARPGIRNCAICVDEPLVEVMALPHDWGTPATLARCPRCGLVQESPLPSEEQLASFYHTYAYDQAAAWEAPPAVLASLSKLLTSLDQKLNA